MHATGTKNFDPYGGIRLKSGILLDPRYKAYEGYDAVAKRLKERMTASETKASPTVIVSKPEEKKVQSTYHKHVVCEFYE